MLTIAFIIIFVVIGVMRARKMGGDTKDQLMYGASFALAGFTIGMIVSLIANLLL